MSDDEITVLANEVVEWIRISAVCEKTGSLPNPGGLFDQREGHVRRLEAVYRARSEYEVEQVESSNRTTTQSHRKEPVLKGH